VSITAATPHTNPQDFAMERNGFVTARKSGGFPSSVCVVLRGGLLLLFIACSDARQGGSDVRRIIEDGFDKQYAYTYIPIGNVTILGGASEMLDGTDFAKKRLSAADLRIYREYEKAGLLTIREDKPVSALDEIGRLGNRFIEVIPSETLRAVDDSTNGRDGYLAIRTSKMRIQSIVRDTAYAPPGMSQTEQYRLVLGTYKSTETETALRVYQTTNPKSKATPQFMMHFKALLKYDPFTKQWVYVTGDFKMPDQVNGIPITSDWKHTIP
jgi:hypothetical protein